MHGSKMTQVTAPAFFLQCTKSNSFRQLIKLQLIIILFKKRKHYYEKQQSFLHYQLMGARLLTSFAYINIFIIVESINSHFLKMPAQSSWKLSSRRCQAYEHRNCSCYCYVSYFRYLYIDKCSQIFSVGFLNKEKTQNPLHTVIYSMLYQNTQTRYSACCAAWISLKIIYV